jgi:hypothetical protein
MFYSIPRMTANLERGRVFIWRGGGCSPGEGESVHLERGRVFTWRGGGCSPGEGEGVHLERGRVFIWRGSSGEVHLERVSKAIEIRKRAISAISRNIFHYKCCYQAIPLSKRIDTICAR